MASSLRRVLCCILFDIVASFCKPRIIFLYDVSAVSFPENNIFMRQLYERANEWVLSQTSTSGNSWPDFTGEVYHLAMFDERYLKGCYTSIAGNAWVPGYAPFPINVNAIQNGYLTLSGTTVYPGTFAGVPPPNTDEIDTFVVTMFDEYQGPYMVGTTVSTCSPVLPPFVVSTFSDDYEAWTTLYDQFTNVFERKTHCLAYHVETTVHACQTLTTTALHSWAAYTCTEPTPNSAASGLLPWTCAFCQFYSPPISFDSLQTSTNQYCETGTGNLIDFGVTMNIDYDQLVGLPETAFPIMKHRYK